MAHLGQKLKGVLNVLQLFPKMANSLFKGSDILTSGLEISMKSKEKKAIKNALSPAIYAKISKTNNFT